MKACIIGAGGLIGRNLCVALVEGGYQVTGITSTSAQPHELPVDDWFCSTSIAAPTVLVDRAPWDLVVDLRAYRPDDLVGLTEDAHNLTKHWIHISTIYVYRRLSEALTLSHGDDFLPVPIPETAPCCPSGPYGMGKLECERLWQRAYEKDDAPVTIVRLPFVYGPHDRSQRALFYLNRLLTRETIYLPSSGDRYIDLLFVEDLAYILVRLAEHPGSIGGVYNIAARPAIPLRRHVEVLAEILGVPARIESTSTTSVITTPAPYAYPVDIALDASRLFGLLGNLPVISLRETWARTIEWEYSGGGLSSAVSTSLLSRGSGNLESFL